MLSPEQVWKFRAINTRVWVNYASAMASMDMPANVFIKKTMEVLESKDIGPELQTRLNKLKDALQELLDELDESPKITKSQGTNEVQT